MRNLITKFMVFMAMLSLYALVTTSPASATNKPKVVATECESSIVVIDQKSGGQFTTSVVKFCDQRSAEEFTDAVNAEPISTNRAAKFKIQRHATLYTQ